MAPAHDKIPEGSSIVAPDVHLCCSPFDSSPVEGEFPFPPHDEVAMTRMDDVKADCARKGP